jgi:hypothetical protein
MELRNLISTDRREYGLSCRNCTKLASEYDLDAERAGVWVCDTFPCYAGCMSFPFEHDMPCFELSFWFSVFSQDLNPNDDLGCEVALDNFTTSLAIC